MVPEEEKEATFEAVKAHLWNQLPASLHRSHSVLSISNFPLPVSIDSPLTSSITLSLFHPQLKMYFFHKSFLPQTLLSQD